MKNFSKGIFNTQSIIEGSDEIVVNGKRYVRDENGNIIVIDGKVVAGKCLDKESKKTKKDVEIGATRT